MLFERAIIELSSLTASVTLRESVFCFCVLLCASSGDAYIKELGFFFFLRMAVAISSSCGGLAAVTSASCRAARTPLGSAPEGSLVLC